MTRSIPARTGQSLPTAAARDPLSRFGHWMKDCFRRLAETQEWQGLHPAERGRIARDVGIGSSDLNALLSESGGSAELEQLLQRTGLRDTAQQCGALHDLQRVCGLCRERGECRDWLAVPAKPHGDATVPSFCPNRAELNALRIRQIRRAGAAARQQSFQ